MNFFHQRFIVISVFSISVFSIHSIIPSLSLRKRARIVFELDQTNLEPDLAVLSLNGDRP